MAEAVDAANVYPQKPVVSILIPTLNEAKAIGKVIKALPFEQLPPTEAVLVDGGSKDGTVEFARRLGAKVVMDLRSGYGRAVLTGLKHVKGDIVVVMDGDGTYEPRDIPKLIKPIMDGEADVVIGSRLKGSVLEGAMPMLNRLGNMILSLAYNMLYFQLISDTQSGLQAWRRKKITQLRLDQTGYTLLTNVLLEAAKHRFRFAEVPASYYRRVGRSKLNPIVDGLKILAYLMTYIIRHRFKG